MELKVVFLKIRKKEKKTKVEV